MYPLFGLVCMLVAGPVWAETLIHLTFDDLVESPVDATWLPDQSGNNYSGFYGGGGAATFTVIPAVDTPSGSTGIGVDTSTEIILRDGLTGRVGQPPEDSPTPTPFPIIEADQSWTLEMVVRVPDTFAGVGGLWAHDAVNTPNGEWWWRITASGDLQFLFDDGSETMLATHDNEGAGLGLKNGDWHHVALVFDRTVGIDSTDGEIRSYVDYIQVGSTPFTSLGAIGDGLRDINVGGFVSGSTTRRLEGDLDEGRISTGVLNPSDFIGGTGSSLAVTRLVRQGEDLVLSWEGQAGPLYLLQQNADLTGDSWIDVPDTTQDGFDGTMSATNQPGTGPGHNGLRVYMLNW